ncbi:MAG: ATP synthase F1 subunit gamma [Bacteroides sp.]|nr:ATP synthase F1 subunit gamma [Bacteroides sp.]
MATLRELKSRIGSVASSEKITGAMKMISSAKMHKAEQALRRLQPFRSQIETIIGNLLTADADFSSPLIESREVKNLTVVLFGSDDGLCGAYNVNLYKVFVARLQEYKQKYGDNVRLKVYPIGAKMLKAVSHLYDPNIEICQMDGVDSKTTGDGVKDFLHHLEDQFLDGTIDKVDIVYMAFKSVSRQRPVSEQLLPINSDTFSSNGVVDINKPYIFEPDPNTVYQAVLPMFLLSVMQDVFTENRASEQAARVMAMQSANDNAKKLLDELHLEYNKLRQESITTELLDILGGQVR